MSMPLELVIFFGEIKLMNKIRYMYINVCQLLRATSEQGLGLLGCLLRTSL